MSELRLTGKNPDGTHLTLTNSDGADFTVRISDTLRATINQPRLVAVDSNEADAPMSVKEIQRRLRAGDTMEVIAREGNITVEKVERFAGPILQERVYILDRAHEVVLRKESGREQESFLEIVLGRLISRGVESDLLSWNSWRLSDGSWMVELHYPNRDGHGSATWIFDLSRRLITASNENGRWMLGDEPTPRIQTQGLVNAQPSHPSRAVTPELGAVDEFAEFSELDEIGEVVERPTPRLVALREPAGEEDRAEGISARAKVPSWDEIMFGRPAPVVQDPDEELFP
jgi:hypothetical protein